MTKLNSLAIALSLIAYLPSDVGGSVLEAGENTIDGAKVLLTKKDIENVSILATDENWSNEEVLTFAHSLVLSGAFNSVSEALAEGVSEFAQHENGASAVELATNLYGDDLADGNEDYAAHPEFGDQDVLDFIDSLFASDEDEDEDTDERD